MKIFVDADSCPAKVRDVITKAALKRGIDTIFVANCKIPANYNERATFFITDSGDGSADNYIIENSCKDDLVITRDIPLAYGLLQKEVIVINDRGEEFNLDTIKSRLSQRDMMKILYESGVAVQGYKNFSLKELEKFSNCFDKILNNYLKK